MSPAVPETLADADVVHLSFNPPFAAGSYNSLIQALVHHDGPLRQMAVSFWDGPVPRSADAAGTLLVGGAGPGPVASAALRLPERARRLAFEGMGSRERIRYASEVADLLAAAAPPVVVIWDDYKLGPFLRRQGVETAAFVLSQHGRSYHLPPERARALYRLDTLDAVITLTHSSYRADRGDLYAYEPLVLVRPNGVDLQRFQPADDVARTAARARWGLPDHGPVVLSLARLAPSKGAHLLLHSWARVTAPTSNGSTVSPIASASPTACASRGPWTETSSPAAMPPPMSTSSRPCRTRATRSHCSRPWPRGSPASPPTPRWWPSCTATRSSWWPTRTSRTRSSSRSAASSAMPPCGRTSPDGPAPRWRPDTTSVTTSTR